MFAELLNSRLMYLCVLDTQMEPGKQGVHVRVISA